MIKGVMRESIFTQKEIKGRLSKVREVYPHLFDHLIGKIEFSKYLRLKRTVRQLLRKILAMGIKDCLKGFSNKSTIKRINSISNAKKILFVTGLPTFNLVGISIYLRKTGEYETVLITENPWLVKFFKQYFDYVYVYNSYYDVAYLLMASKPYIIHVQGALQYYFLGVMANFLSRTPVIVGFNDIPSLSGISADEVSSETRDKLHQIPNVVQSDLFSEEFLFKNADGIILAINTFVAGDQLRHYYKSTIPLLEFSTYVCDEFLCDEEKYSRKDGKIHIVYGGIVVSSDKPKELCAGVQFIGLAKKLINQRLCFHMYISPHFSPFQIRKLFPDYIQLASETPSFIFKRGLPQDVAIKEFSKYDFATMSSLFDSMKLNKFHRHTVVASKFFTYLSAGIPMIVTEEDGNSMALVRKYGVGIVIKQNEIEHLSEIIKTCDYEKLKSNIKQAQEELSLKKHINRLIEFYNQVANSYGQIPHR